MRFFSILFYIFALFGIITSFSPPTAHGTDTFNFSAAISNIEAAVLGAGFCIAATVMWVGATLQSRFPTKEKPVEKNEAKSETV
jgi:drug/metabolite transporter (DMT)-like permease